MFGLHGSLQTDPEDRDELLDHLLKAADLLQEVDGCLLYVISKDANDAGKVWVTEVWESAEDHQASLTLDAVKELIAASRPLMTGDPEGTIMVPVGGKGL